jgi:Glu-tRNA(Gln) amidotransferase subunit E-like FAD-binding protein
MASFFTAFIKNLEKKGYTLPQPDNPFWKNLLNNYTEKNLYKEALKVISKRSFINEENLEEIIKPMKKLSTDETSEIINNILHKDKDMVYKRPDKRLNFLMGQIMYQYGGMVNPVTVKEELNSKLEEKYV